MENRQFWHLQMHPNDRYNFDAKLILKVLEEKKVIGIGFEHDTEHRELKQFKSKMHTGDIVAVRSGHKPIALVEVVGDWYREENINKEFDWFHTRRPIKILSVYKEGVDSFSIPMPATLAVCRDPSKDVSKTIMGWYSRVMKEKLNNEELFKEWLSNNNRPEQYVRDVKGISKKANTENILQGSIFEITDGPELEKVFQKCADKGLFLYENNHSWNTAKSNYLKFFYSIDKEPEPKNNSKIISLVNGLPLNKILFGPPGTGKTYNSINKALEIIDRQFYNQNKDNRDKLVARFRELLFDYDTDGGQIGFITFHQSMSYEDFIEGIKPLKPEDGQEFVIYDVVPGLFKRLCTVALEKNTSKNFEEAYDKFTADVLDNNGLKLNTPTHNKPFNVRINSKSSCVAVPETVTATNMVLTKDLLRDYIINGAIRDWKPYTVAIGEYIKKQYKVKVEQEDNSKKNFVLVIDEINRGNISQIFGELITLIEEDKRIGKDEALTVTLPYSKEKFGVPPNLYIIGTMNTADRSVEALDTALRRRFTFEEIPPDSSLIKTKGKLQAAGVLDGIDLADVMDTMNKRIFKLLDKDHLIGHSYFMSVMDLKGLQSVFQDNINPLLQEYFYGDFGKIGLVIGKGFFEEEGEQKSKDDNLFAPFTKDYESADLAERQVYKLKNVAGMETEEFIKAINTLLNKQVENPS